MSTYIILFAVAIVVGIFVRPLYGILIGIAALIFVIYEQYPNYFFVKGDQAYAGGDISAALEYYKKGYKTKRVKFQRKINYSSLLTRAGKPDEALEILNPLLASTQLKPEQRIFAKQYRCMANYRKGEIDEALEEAEEMYNDGIKNTFLYSMIGLFRLIKNDTSDETLNLCREAYEFNSDERDLVDNLALVLYMRGEYEEAKEYADEETEKHPDFIEGRYHAAQIYHALGDDKTAAEHLEKIAECKRSPMTTISEEMIEELKVQIGGTQR